MPATAVVLAAVLHTPTSSWAQSPPAATTVVVGTNVNMAGGPASFTPPSTLIGDPFLQRQNEPSLALSSRNPCHILAGANDYRLVDLEEAVGETGDAWLGVFKSFDCGATWTSTLLPGHTLDASPEGLVSPIKGLQAGADPTVRAGTSGMFYYSGLALNRGDGEVGKVFVARFIDLNNKDGGDPIRYLDTLEIDRGTSGQFLDKPWVATDIPRGTGTCAVAGQTIPAGPVYVTYSTFLGSGNNVRTRINFRRSLDCGRTWSSVQKLSERFARNQGTAMAVDPGTGHIYIAWREFAVAGSSLSANSILVVRSTDGGRSFSAAQPIAPSGYNLQPFDQASSPLTFRTNAYPTITVVPAEAEGRAAGQPGRVYVAWAGRGFGTARPSDARILLSSSLDGAAWTAPRPADDYPGAGHQIMPALTFAGGRLALAYYDLRDDFSNGFDDLVIEYGQAAYDRCLAQHGSFGFAAVYSCVISAPEGLSSRHTLDMRAALADASCLASNGCAFTSYSVLPEDGGGARVSRYREGRGHRVGPTGTDSPKVQLQYNRPNLPLFSRGRFPFIGDYIDIAGEQFVFTPQGWRWNTGLTANRPAPVFHVSWADNRNVGSPRTAPNLPESWEAYTPPVIGPNSVVCVPGQVGIRNQDVYTATLRPGLVVSAPTNSKRIAGLQRTFVVVARNTTDLEREYVMEITPPAGVIASFDQFRGFGATDASGNPIEPLTSLTLRIPRKSSASRTVFVGLTNPNTPIDVLVPVEVAEVVPGTTTETGVFDNVFINPDFENPDFENPDFENAEFHNPDFENPDFENPDFENPDFENFTLSAESSIRNPDFENPDFENPDFENPDFENPDFENPDFENPDFENPDFENPDFENPDFENPDFENPDFENGSFQVADTTWPVRNKGNTTSGYKTNVYVNQPPDGVRYQLIVRRIFESPAAVCAIPGSTEAPATASSVALVNVVNPNVQINPYDRSFNDPSRDNITFHLAPNERAMVTLRAYCSESSATCSRDLVASLQNNIALGVVAQGANCATCTGAACSNLDFVSGPTECMIEEGPPRDIYDPLPPLVDVLNPTVTTPEVAFVRDDADNSGAEVVSFDVSASDNVAVASVACLADGIVIDLLNAGSGVYRFGGTFPVGVTGVTCTASDVRAPAPNTARVSFLVDVRDVTAPIFENPDSAGEPFTPGNPAEATGPNGAQVFFTNPTATDTNGGAVTVACASPTGLVSGSTFPIGTTEIDCIATDGSGVSTQPTNLFDIMVADHTAPSVTVVGAPTASVEGNVLGGARVTFTSSATDIVSGTLAATCAPASGSVFAVGTTTVRCTAADGAGNSGEFVFPVTVIDTTAPTVTLNGQSSVTLEAGSAYTDAGASATDVVYGTVSITSSGTVNALLPGTYVITYVATDGSGNTATALRTVTVRDTTAPVFGPVGNLSVEATSAAGAQVTYTTPTASDTVGVTTVSCVPASNSAFPLGTTTVTCTARDAALNTSVSTFTVTVRDTTPPVFSPAPANLTVEATSAAGATVTYAPTATDAVTLAVTVTCNPASGSTFAIGTTSVTCTARDAALNTTTAGFTVTVRDTTPPIVVETATPNTLLWSPNKTMTPVTIAGRINEIRLRSASFEVWDEYVANRPILTGTVTVGADGSYSFIVTLEAWRLGTDYDGRVYTIRIRAEDLSGNVGAGEVNVLVPHNQ